MLALSLLLKLLLRLRPAPSLALKSSELRCGVRFSDRDPLRLVLVERHSGVVGGVAGMEVERVAKPDVELWLLPSLLRAVRPSESTRAAAAGSVGAAWSWGWVCSGIDGMRSSAGVEP
jgi:hypothetical protein